jgi:hypothetical protein
MAAARPKALGSSMAARPKVLGSGMTAKPLQNPSCLDSTWPPDTRRLGPAWPPLWFDMTARSNAFGSSMTVISKAHESYMAAKPLQNPSLLRSCMTVKPLPDPRRLGVASLPDPRRLSLAWPPNLRRLGLHGCHARPKSLGSSMAAWPKANPSQA